MLLLPKNLISGILGLLILPSFKKLKSNREEFEKEFFSLNGIISIINFPIALILILFPDIFVNILWGARWAEVTDFLPYFGLLIIYQTILVTSGQIFILFNKERIQFRISILNNSLIIISLCIGAFFSPLYVALFYTLCFNLLIIPIHLYVGYYKSFNLRTKNIIKFWGLKLVIGLLIIFSIWQGLIKLRYILMFIYLIHIIIFQKKDLIKLKKIIVEKLQKK